MQRIHVAAAAVLGIVAALVFAGGAAVAGRSPICTRGLTTVEVDPRGLLPLESNSVGLSAAAALRRESPKAKPLVTSATLATADTGRGRGAKFECGTRVWRRTVVVYITLRAFLPSASLSERVDYAGRFRGGYKVWQVVH
jgi:hypothetical protein